MDDNTLAKIIDRCMDDRSIERYVALAGKKATKTDCRALAAEVVPLLVDKLDSKASKDTQTSDKLHQYMAQAFETQADEDPKFGAAILTTLLGSKKGEVITFHADNLLVHPFVIENMMIAMAPSILRAYGNELGRDIFHRGPLAGLFGAAKPTPAPAPKPAPAPAPKPAPAPAQNHRQPSMGPEAGRMHAEGHRTEGGRGPQGGFFGGR